MALQEMGLQGVYWICLAQDRPQWRAVLNPAMYFRVRWKFNLLNKLEPVQCFENNCSSWTHCRQLLMKTDISLTQDRIVVFRATGRLAGRRQVLRTLQIVKARSGGADISDFSVLTIKRVTFCLYSVLIAVFSFCEFDFGVTTLLYCVIVRFRLDVNQIFALVTFYTTQIFSYGRFGTSYRFHLRVSCSVLELLDR